VDDVDEVCDVCGQARPYLITGWAHGEVVWRACDGSCLLTVMEDDWAPLLLRRRDTRKCRKHRR
jgi:hypothetical protein